ncbi:hypothetical protein B0H14DRAFT_3603334 [Mycena olivaceomarginata]|nr:hypothetical protein B0H14DRAFT_3603334 [Mycena olivaceomarginata]
MLITWIAAHIYFVWSPDLTAHTGFVVCVVGRRISAFTHAHRPRASSGAHREGLIQTFDIEKLAYELDSHTLYPLLGFTQLAGGVDNKQHLFIGTDVLHADGAGVDSLKPMRTAPFRIPRPWEADAPALTTDRSEHLLDFLDQVDMIIELGHVADEQEQKNLLTSYLPVTKRLLWREMKTYEAAHSFAEFRMEICALHPEIAERARGSLEGLDELCKSFGKISRSSTGILRRFSLQFCALVEKLQRPPALLTNRDACAKYLQTLDDVFAQHVRKTVGERQIMRVLLRQLGVKTQKENLQRKEDLIQLRDLVEIVDTIAAVNTAYLMDPRDGSHTTRCTASALQEAIMESFAQEPGRGYATHVEDEPRVWSSARDRWMAGRRVSVGNFEDMEEHISILLSRMQELESTVTQDVNDLATWCWDGIGGLWNETSGFQDELEDGLIQVLDEERPPCTPDSYFSDTSFGSAGGIDDKQQLFIAMDEHDINDNDNVWVDTQRTTRIAPFRILRPWEKYAPMFITGGIDDLADFLDNVDTIIELGHVRNGQERKVLLTSYLPVSVRSLWRGLGTYEAVHSYAEFRMEIGGLYPELAAREQGSLASLEKLCVEFDGIKESEEGRLRRFGIQFCLLVKKLERPLMLVTNSYACTRYWRVLDCVFAKRICRAVEEREIARVMLQQLGVASKVEEGHAQRKEDVILLRELVGIAEAIARTDVSYLHGDGANKALGDISAPEPHHAPRNDSLGVFTQISDGAVTVAKEVMDLGMAQPCWKTEAIGKKPAETALAEISALTERMRTLETSVGEELQEVSMWCRDQFNGLWEETAVMGNELGIVQDELRTIQRQLKGITVAAITRNEETHLEMDKLERRMHEVEDSSSQGFRDIFDTERDAVDVLRKEMVQDKLRSIQRQLKETREPAPRTQETHLGMDMLGRRMQENRDLRLEDL